MRSRSSTVTVAPRMASWCAHETPMTPPPMMMTSIVDQAFHAAAVAPRSRANLTAATLVAATDACRCM
ncbi:MAG: hypothetical protein QM736_18250 [Vicinamibacterales bacterium]